MDIKEEDQVADDINDDEKDNVDETSDEQSTEDNEEPITPERAYELAKGLQKGYTLTRQELAEIRDNINAIQEALSALKSSSDIGDFGIDEDRPLTKKELMETLAELERKKEEENTQKQKIVDKIIDDLKFEGTIKDDKEADKFIEFTLNAAKKAGLKEVTPNYILSLVPAWEKIKEAEQVKSSIKGKVKGEIGSKVGNSEKVNPNEQGISWNEVHNKDWDELI